MNLTCCSCLEGGWNSVSHITAGVCITGEAKSELCIPLRNYFVLQNVVVKKRLSYFATSIKRNVFSCLVILKSDIILFYAVFFV